MAFLAHPGRTCLSESCTDEQWSELMRSSVHVAQEGKRKPVRRRLCFAKNYSKGCFRIIGFWRIQIRTPSCKRRKKGSTYGSPWSLAGRNKKSSHEKREERHGNVQKLKLRDLENLKRCCNDNKRSSSQVITGRGVDSHGRLENRGKCRNGYGGSRSSGSSG